MNNKAAIFLLLLSFSVLAQSQVETNRQPLLNSVYARFAPIIAQALKPYDGWSPAENEILHYMTQASKYYISTDGSGGPLKPSIPLRFSKDQSVFQVVAGAPPRTAVIGPNLGDPIYFNLNIINQNENPLRISQITQLLMHEFGHFAPKKRSDENYLKERQALIDSIAAKVGKRVEALEKQLTLSDGTIIRAMSATDVFFGTIKTPTPTIDQFIAFNPFFFIVEKEGQVSDQTVPLLNQLESRRRFEVTEDGKGDYHRIYYWNVESLEQVKENDPAHSWLKLRATQVDFVMDAKKDSITADDFADVLTAPDKAIGLHEFVVGLNKSNNTLDRIFSAQRYQALKVDDTMNARIVREDSSHVVIRVQLDSATYQVGDEKHIRLILQEKDRNMAVQGKKINQNEYEFNIPKPSIAFDFSIESIAVHEKMQVFFKQALHLTEANQQVAKKQFKLQKIGLTAEGHYQPLKAEMHVPTQKGTLEFLVETDVPLREIEIYESKAYRILNDEANRDFVRAPLRTDLKTPSIRSDFQIRIFDNVDLIQEKISEGIYKITVPYDFSLSPLNLNPKNALHDAIKKNPLEAFLNMQRYLEDALKQPVSGTDLGIRALYHIRLTNQNFEELTVYEDKPFYIRSLGKNPYIPIRRSCRSLLN